MTVAASKGAAHRGPVPAEQRRDPDDGQLYTLRELQQKYYGAFPPEEVVEYWEVDCQRLRPQEPQAEQRIDPDDGQLYTLEGFQRRHAGGEFSEQEVLDYWHSDCVPVTADQFAGADARPAEKSPQPASAAVVSLDTVWLEWLRSVAPSGELDHHVGALRESFDSPGQILDIYMVSGPRGGKVLDSHFFADLGVDREQEIRLFKEWFVRQPGAGAAAAASTPASRSRASPDPAAQPGSDVATLRPRFGSLAQWLQEVDPAGSLSCYLSRLIENFDNTSQITETYVSVAKAGSRRQHSAGRGKKILDHDFFTDLGVEDEEHRELFKAWFAKKLGASYEEPPPPPPASPPPSEEKQQGSGDEVSEYHYWPQDIPREQQNRARRLLHSSVKSWHPRERVHGPQRLSQGLAAPIMLRMKRPGDERTYPQRGDTLTVHYTGTLADGTTFDSSWDRQQPLRFVVGVGQVITGWDQGLLRMSLGERSVLHVPNILAYGEEGKGDLIPPFADLDFDVELLKVEEGNDQGIKAEEIPDPRDFGMNMDTKQYFMQDD